VEHQNPVKSHFRVVALGVAVINILRSLDPTTTFGVFSPQFIQLMDDICLLFLLAASVDWVYHALTASLRQSVFTLRFIHSGIIISLLVFPFFVHWQE